MQVNYGNRRCLTSAMEVVWHSAASVKQLFGVWIGLDWVELCWIGLDWVGLGWIGLSWVGLGWWILLFLSFFGYGTPPFFWVCFAVALMGIELATLSLPLVRNCIWQVSHGADNCLNHMKRNAYIKMWKPRGFWMTPPRPGPHYMGLIMCWVINGIGNSWRGWTGTVFGVGFGQRLKLVVLPLNAWMLMDAFASDAKARSSEEVSGFKFML